MSALRVGAPVEPYLEVAKARRFRRHWMRTGRRAHPFSHLVHCLASVDEGVCGLQNLTLSAVSGRQPCGMLMLRARQLRCRPMSTRGKMRDVDEKVCSLEQSSASMCEI